MTLLDQVSAGAAALQSDASISIDRSAGFYSAELSGTHSTRTALVGLGASLTEALRALGWAIAGELRYRGLAYEALEAELDRRAA